MNEEQCRLDSFEDWPYTEDTHPYASPFELAASGFYYAPRDADDRVECFACSISLFQWEPNDKPMEEHAKHAPFCPFVLDLPCSNVPIDDDDDDDEMQRIRRRIMKTKKQFKERYPIPHTYSSFIDQHLDIVAWDRVNSISKRSTQRMFGLPRSLRDRGGGGTETNSDTDNDSDSDSDDDNYLENMLATTSSDSAHKTTTKSKTQAKQKLQSTDTEDSDSADAEPLTMELLQRLDVAKQEQLEKCMRGLFVSDILFSMITASATTNTSDDNSNAFESASPESSQAPTSELDGSAQPKDTVTASSSRGGAVLSPAPQSSQPLAGLTQGASDLISADNWRCDDFLSSSSDDEF